MGVFSIRELSKVVTITLDGIYNWIQRVFESETVLGGPPGFRESPEMELSWADRLVIREFQK